jgi:glycosyltransferase involved in cell wall biosynthesis
MCLVSIIIPFYNASETLARCLDSFINQTFDESYEVICIGHNVSDKSHEIAQEYSQKHPNLIKFFLHDGKGVATSRNYGLNVATGKYVMFADSDDFVEPNIIKSCYDAIIKNDSDFVCCGFDRVDEAGKLFSRERPADKESSFEINPENLLRLAFIYPATWGKLYKRSLIGDTRFPVNSISSYDDIIFFTSLSPKISNFTLLPDILYHYIVYQSSFMNQATLERSIVFRKDLLKIKDLFVESDQSDRLWPLLNLVAFIHVGVADVHRVAEIPEVALRDFIAGAKNFLSRNFPGWSSLSPRGNSYFKLRGLAVVALKTMYKLNIFNLFIICYNFMIRRLHVDIKW